MSTKMFGTDKMRRTCKVTGRNDEQGNPITFYLIRKNVSTTKVIPVGSTGEPEEVDSNLITDERITPRPARHVAGKDREPKSYPADKPQRRMCLIEGRGDTRFHLLRQGVEQSHILELGQGGVGEWIDTDKVKEVYLTAQPAKARHIERKPVRVVQLDNDPQEYILLRKTSKGARVVPVYEKNYGVTVDPARITKEEVINQAKKEKKTEAGNGDGQVDGTVTAQAPDEQAPVAQAPAAQPVAQAPVAQPVAQAQPAHQQGAPVARPQPQHPQHPQGAAPRPAPVGQRPTAPQGRPVGR